MEQKKHDAKRRKVTSARERLRKFREKTMYNASFICTSCQTNHFDTNVVELTRELREKISAKKFGLLEECIEAPGKLTQFNGRQVEFICKTCKKHLLNRKMPPMSAMNGLQLIPIIDPQLRLSELEGALIAKDLVFQKVYQLPKSRWTALKDKIVNIPIGDDDILNTLEQLPRTPKDAGLIGVELKRKKEYKNTHKQQLIDPQKLYKMLDRLRSAGNPYYKFYDDYEAYENKCMVEDPVGHSVMFRVEEDEDDEIFEKLDLANYFELSDHIEKETDKEEDKGNEEKEEEKEADEKEEIEYLTKDAVRKWQFDYNKSLCLTNKYPEVTAAGNNDIPIIQIAPGEGKKPRDIMKDKDWDIKAFPHLNNPDGKNGKDHEREVKLTDQYYFIQRILNADSRFARSSAYIYAAVAYLEKKQLARNINLSYTRGKQVDGDEGRKKLELEDGYAVLDDIKGTPKYWRKYKYELLAKLDNLGPFQLFFTLSCADMRWYENVAAILRERNYEVKYKLVPEGEDLKTKVTVKMPDDSEKDLENFLKEDIDESLHEFIRNNVLLATRYFSHRVKVFIREVMMGKNNPMNVNYHTEKIEFQDRGAGHVHGTLWLNLHKIEKLVKMPDGSLQNPPKQEGEGKEKTEEKLEEKTEEKLEECPAPDLETPFKHIRSAFRKFRNEEPLREVEKEAVKNFADAFSTCSLNPDTVGADVAKIAYEVQRHHHTKTCKKYDTSCRFGYRKFPSPITIIRSPYTNYQTQEEKNAAFKVFEETLEKVKKVIEDDEVIAEIMQKYDKETETREEYEQNRKKRIKEVLDIAEVSEGSYLEALSYSKAGYSIVLQRDIDETDVNSYNIEMLRAWNANMDIQVCLDFFAIITYITEYVAKTDSALMEVIKGVLEKSPEKTGREKMALIANVFQTHRQIGESEAYFKLISSLTLKDSNVKTQWLAIGTRDEVTKRMKLATKEDIESGLPLVEIEGQDGLYYEQPDMLSKYLRRSEKIESICPVQYAKMFTSDSRIEKKREEVSENVDENELDSDDDDDDDDDPESKFHYIMTSNPRAPKQRLPDVDTLQWTYPKETKHMRKRRFPAVIRFHKVNRDRDPDKYMLNELMLYTPYRDIKELQKDTLEKFQEKDPVTGKSKIKIVKEQVMEHLESVEEARYNLLEAEKKKDMERIGMILDSTFHQDNAECQEEGLEEHPDYLHLDPEDMGMIDEDGGLQVQSTYRSIEIPSDNVLNQKSRGLDEQQRMVLDIGIKYAKDIVKSRKDGNVVPNPPMLMVHGGAGSGKSTVINLLASWMQLILLKSGDDPDCPYIIKCSFTGTAAANIQGQTMHSAFGFSFDNKHHSLSDKKREEKRKALRNLKIVIIDEISMVRVDMFYQLDLRLQEIKERPNIPFGGVSLMCFGDLMQLKPCLGRYICDKPSNPEFHITHLLASRWSMLQVLNLETNHRQGEDKTYADLLNRIRIGAQTEEDMELLKTRVRKKDHTDLKTVGLIISCTRKTVAKYNEDYIESLDGDEIKSEARHHLQTKKKFKPKIHPEGTVGKSSFMNILKLKLGVKVILIHNIDTADCLTNGQLGILMGILYTVDGEVDKLVVKFHNESAGKDKRKRFPGITAKFPGGTVIERTTFKYCLSEKNSQAGAQAAVVQFPLKLAHAITTHKIQGQTIAKPIKVLLDIESSFEAAMVHVMLSRVQAIDQVYILEKLTESKIRVDSLALMELHSMNERSLNKKQTAWNKKSKNTIKIASLNCARLQPHIADIWHDFKLQKADMIHLQETWLTEDDNMEQFRSETKRYKEHFVNVGPGKGLVTYYRDQFQHESDIKAETFQITKFSSDRVDSINVYRSQNGNLQQLNNQLHTIINMDKTTLITGDFNLCSMTKNKNKTTIYLKELGFKQYLIGATHIAGGHIDHLYMRQSESEELEIRAERCSSYYSDHDSILITLTIKSESPDESSS